MNKIPELEKELEVLPETNEVVTKEGDLSVGVGGRVLEALEADKDNKAMGSIYDLVPRVSIDLSDMVPEGLEVVQTLDLNQLKENMEQDFSMLMDQIDGGLVIEGEPLVGIEFPEGTILPPAWQDKVV